MGYWFEVLKSFDEPEKEHPKEGKYRQAPAVLALMYLALGRDYPYRMAKIFQSALAIEERGFSILKHEGKLASLLKEMETKGLLINVPDTKVGRKPRKFYKINPRIIQSDKAPTEKTTAMTIDGKGIIVDIPVELIENLLAWLEESNALDEMRKRLLAEWSSMDEFNFITFLLFLKETALAWESSKPKETFLSIIQSSKDLSQLFQTKKKLSQYIEEYLLKLQSEYKRTPATKDIISSLHGPTT